MLKQAEREPRLNAETAADPHIGILRGGAIPVVVNGERIGIVAMSGAGAEGTRDMDDACALVAAKLLSAS